MQQDRHRRCGPARRDADDEVWIARFGRLVEKRPSDQYGILYDTLVNTVRGADPARASRSSPPRSTAIATSADRQSVDAVERRGDFRAADRAGERPQHRPAPHARHGARGDEPLPFDQHRLRRQAGGPAALRLSGADLFPERPADRMAYVTLFPIGTAMRANLFVYRDMDDPWLRQMRDAPQRDAADAACRACAS